MTFVHHSAFKISSSVCRVAHWLGLVVQNGVSHWKVAYGSRVCRIKEQEVLKLLLHRCYWSVVTSVRKLLTSWWGTKQEDGRLRRYSDSRVQHVMTR